MPGDQRRIFFLAAKAAASFSLNHANLFFRQAEQFDQRFVNVVRTLHRAPNRHAVVRVRDRNRAVVLDVELLLRAGFVFAFDDEIGAGPDVVDVALIDQKLFEDVVFAPDDLFFRQRIFERKDRAAALRFRCAHGGALLRADICPCEPAARSALPDD